MRLTINSERFEVYLARDDSLLSWLEELLAIELYATVFKFGLNRDMAIVLSVSAEDLMETTATIVVTSSFSRFRGTLSKIANG